MLRRVMGWISIAYAGLCAASLLLVWASAYGVLGVEPDPLSGIYAVLLAQPWLSLVGPDTGSSGFGPSLVRAILCMAINMALIRFVWHLLPKT